MTLKTLAPKTFKISPRPAFRNKGFTLLELMIVLAIIGAVVSLAIPQIGNRNNQLKAAVRRFNVVAKQLRNSARLKNVTYRLAIDMGTDERPSEHKYWIEKSESPDFLKKTKEELEEQEADKTSPFSENEKGELIYTPPDGFSIDKKLMKKPTVLETGLKFEDIELLGGEEPIKQGIVYIHFYAQGLAEESAIHILLEGTDTHWTVAIHPLTGKTDIVTEYITLEDIRKQ
jgi:general secretion pathway protein H